MNNVSLGDGLDDSLEVQGSTYGQCGSFLDGQGIQWPSSQLMCPIKQNVLMAVSITEPPKWSLPSRDYPRSGGALCTVQGAV